ncbi:MAG TPA: Hsp20/alpha crystallin family protein [Methylibium sp.]
MFLIPSGRHPARNGHAVYFNRAFDRLFDDAFDRAFGEAAPSRAPALDLVESDTGYTVTVDLPGVAKEDVKVSIDGRKLTLQAQSKVEKEQKDGERVLYRERSVASYSRSFTLPVEVDQAASQAKLDNGVLTLTLVKKAQPGASQLTVN